MGRVNAQTVIYQNPHNATTINAMPNTTLPVGAIAGGDASGNGTAAYLIPIAVPKGTNNIQPSVSITYNSGSKNGLVGYGNNINSFGTITRSSKNVYFDGFISPINFTNEDAFYLEGQISKINQQLNQVEVSIYQRPINTTLKIP